MRYGRRNQASLHYAYGMSTDTANATINFHTVREAVLRVLPDVQLLYVFGSRARGMARAESDLDLAIWVGPRIDSMQLYRAKQTLEVALDVDVDLVDLAAANTVLRLEVVRDGKLLHQHGDEQAIAFEARVLGDYAELMDATREIRESIRKRGTVYAV